MATPGYLRFPHLHDDLLAFVAEDDVWLAPAEGGRAWRLTSDGGQASHPRFAPDGATIAWTSWRDGGIPEVYTADTDGGIATRRTYWGDMRTRVTGWTRDGEVLAITAVDQPSAQRTMAFAVPLGAPPRRLPFGQVNDLARSESATVLLTAQRGDPAHWKRYRGGTAGRLWVARGEDPLFTRVLSQLTGQLAAPMIIDGRLVFLSDHEGTGNIYSTTLDGGDLRRHTDHDGFYVRNPATDGSHVVYHVAGDIWRLDSLDVAARPRKLDIQLTAPPAARAPRVITAADHLGELGCDHAGQASVVEVRGTVHWLTHADGPARALSVNPAARARLPVILGTTGKVAWVTDAGANNTRGRDAIQVAEIDAESAATVATLTSVDLGNITRLVASPDGARLAAASHDGRLALIDVESGEVTELTANDDGDIEDVSWSPDSAWLAWAQPGPQPLARIRLGRVADGFTVDVTDARFVDSDPVFTVDGLYLAFLSRRTFDPVYDAHSFDLSFPFGARPYLVPLAAHTLSPFGPLPGGRPVGGGDNGKDAPERVRLTVDTDGISSRVVAVPVDEARYHGRPPPRAACCGCAPRCPACSARGSPTRTTRTRGPCSTVRPAQARVERPRWRGQLVRGERRRRPARHRRPGRRARRPRRPEGGQRLVRRSGQRGPDPGAVPRGPGGAVAARVRGVRPAAAPRLLDDGHVRRGLGRVSRNTAPARPGQDLGRVRRPAVGGGRGTRHVARLRHPVGHFLQPLGAARPARRAARRDVVRAPDGRWIVERVLPGESSDPHARSPFTAPAWPSVRVMRSSRWTAGLWMRCTARAGLGGHARQAGRADGQARRPVPGTPPAGPRGGRQGRREGRR